jgi:hypothetical protein
MKLHVLMMIGLILALMTLKPVLCRAQAEIAPDHYNATGIDPVTLSGNAVEANREAKDFHGTFTLPFDVRYAGLTLLAGTYRFSIHALGQKDALALITKGDATQVQVRMKIQSRSGTLNALLVEHEGQKRTLKAISLKNPGIMLYLQAEQPRNLAENTELVPISYTTLNGVAN